MAIKGKIWGGELGFSLARWANWRDRFEQIAGGDTSAHVEEAAMTVVRVMRFVDESNTGEAISEASLKS